MGFTIGSTLEGINNSQKDESLFQKLFQKLHLQLDTNPGLW